MEVRELKVLQDIDLSQNSIKNVSELSNDKAILIKSCEGGISVISKNTSIEGDSSVSIGVGDFNKLTVDNNGVTIVSNNLAISDSNTSINKEGITTAKIESTTINNTDSIITKSITMKSNDTSIIFEWNTDTNSLVFKKA